MDREDNAAQWSRNTQRVDHATGRRRHWDQRTSATHHTRRFFRKRIKGDNSGSRVHRDSEEHVPRQRRMDYKGSGQWTPRKELYSRSRDDRVFRSTKHLRQTWAEQRERLQWQCRGQVVPEVAETVERCREILGDNPDFTRLIKGETLRVNGTFVFINAVDVTEPHLCGSGWGPN